MTENKIALVIAGGASLGAYEAGVLTELLYLLESYNKKNTRSRYVIDVITGGSAGSINGALLARILMHGYQHRHILHDLWVADTDIMQLLDVPCESALFSGRYQQSIGDKYLDTSADVLTASSFSPARLELCFSLGNMVGVDYGLPYNIVQSETAAGEASECSSWTFFADYFRASLDQQTAPGAPLWQGIKQGSIASGGFPVAFTPSFLPRHDSGSPGNVASMSLPDNHAISDGGMYDDAPLMQAIELASKLDGGLPENSRKFILVDPASNVNVSFAKTEGVENIFANLKRLAVMALGEAAAKDWLKAGEVNRRVHWQQQLIETLPALINALSESTISAIYRTHQNRSKAIAVKMQELAMPVHPGGVCAHVDRSIKLILERFNTETFAIGIPGESEAAFSIRRAIFAHMVFGINAAGSLSNKSLIDISIIAANPDETAVEDFFALGGFFEQHWREHDFRLGRRNAAELLPAILNEEPMLPEPGVKYASDPSWGDLTKVTIKDANTPAKKAFNNRVMMLIESVLKTRPFNLGWASRKLAKWILARYVRNALGL